VKKPEVRPPIHPLRPLTARQVSLPLSTAQHKPATRARAAQHVLNQQPILPPEREEEEGAVSADASAVKTASAYSTAMIPNIDEGDEEQPQLVSDYVNDIYNYLRHLEREQPIEEGYLIHMKSPVTARMRGILVDWLVQVHIRFHLLPETMYMTVFLIDRYLQLGSVPREKLQLVGVTAMFVASKYEEMYAPEIGDFEYITDHSYTKQQIRLMEIDILQSLDFNIGRPLPIHFLRRFSKAADAEPDLHTLAKYLLELSWVELGLSHVSPSLLAASALWLALTLKNNAKWSKTLIHYTRYTEEDMGTVVRRLARLVIKTHNEKTKHQAVRRKYGSSKFLSISQHDCFDIGLLLRISSSKQ
jgi:cyclin B